MRKLSVRNNTMGSKQVGINMIANIISYSANIVVSFILTPFLINTIGKETYSFYPLANTIVMYMSILTNGLNTMASRFVTVNVVKEQHEEANRYYASAALANLVISLILSVPMILIIIFIDKVLEVPINAVASIRLLFTLVFSSALVNISTSVFGIATFAKNRIDLRSLREIVTAVLRLLLFFLLYVILPPSIVYVGVVTLAVALVNVVFQFNYTKQLLPEMKLQRRYVSRSHTKEMISASAWNMINSLGNMLLSGSTVVLANILYGATEAGTYSIVQTVPQFVNGIISMLVGVFFPVITYHVALGAKENIVNEIHKAQSTVGFFACSVIVVFSVLAGDFFALWVPDENAQYLAVLSLCTIIPHMFIACFWSLTNLNVAMNKVKVPALFMIGIGAANILLAVVIKFVFQPPLIFLPILSSCLQGIWVGVFLPFYAAKELQQNRLTFYGPFFKALACILPVAAITFAIRSLVQIHSWGVFILVGAISGFIALVIFGFAMLGKKRILQLIKAKSFS